MLLAASAACGGAETPGERARLQRLLDRQAEAVLAGDRAAYLRTVDPKAAGYLAGQRRVIRNLLRLPLAQWSYRITGTGAFPLPEEPGPNPRRIAARVELSYRLRGWDGAPVVAEEYLTLTRRGGRWYVSSDRDGDPAGRRGTEHLWEQGEVTVVQGNHSLVLGVGRKRSELHALAVAADRAVPAVDSLWPHRWERRVVVEVPASLQRMAALLDAPAASYRGIAAVTTGEVGRSVRAPADRVVLNPQAYPALGESARQIVLTHEMAHVATRTHTSAATPLWLSEGFADWLGYWGTDRSVREVAPSLADAVQTGERPRHLPGDAEFSFDGDAGRLGRAYESGWLACRMIAEQWSPQRLVEFYTAVGAFDRREERRKAVDTALHRTLAVDRTEFTARWRSYLAAELAPVPTGAAARATR